MLPHKKMASAFTETISNKIFFCFFTVYLTGGTSSGSPFGDFAVNTLFSKVPYTYAV